MRVRLFFIFISFSLFIVGCGTVKQTAVSNLSKEESTVTTSRDLDASTLIDTTKIDGKVVSIVKVEFFPDSPPPIISREDDREVQDSAPLVEDQPRPTNTVTTNGTTISGAIKSAEIVEIEQTSEVRRKTETQVTEQTDEVVETAAETQSAEEVIPVKDPRRFLWLAVLIGVSLIAALIVYAKFIKPLNIGSRIAGIASKFGNLLKKG